MGMQTIKFGYVMRDEQKRALFLKVLRQYNSCVHIAYNRLFNYDASDDMDSREIRSDIYQGLSDCNNIELIPQLVRSYAVADAMAVKERFGDRKVVFGGKLNLSRFQRKLISKEEFSRKRLNPITLQGHASNHGNEYCVINDDRTVTFKLNRDTHFTLELLGHSEGRKDKGTWKLLNSISELQKERHCRIAVTFKIDADHVYISFPNTIYGKNNHTEERLTDRTFSIDMNPNYIGWSVNDWDGKGGNNLITHGVFSVKELNDRDRTINGESGKTTLKNKRHNEICIIAKKLAQKAAYFRCNVVAYEKLEFDPKNKNKGLKKLNRLLNRNWCRTKFLNTFLKWLNVYGYAVKGKKSKNTTSNILEVVAKYSSFIGNVVYGDRYSDSTPDPVNASIEIGRRANEFYHQYILKDKSTANIIYPAVDSIAAVCARALEANGIDVEFRNWKQMKKCFDSKWTETHGKGKNSGALYRVPFDPRLKWFESSSARSFIQHFEKSRL